MRGPRRARLPNTLREPRDDLLERRDLDQAGLGPEGLLVVGVLERPRELWGRTPPDRRGPGRARSRSGASCPPSRTSPGRCRDGRGSACRSGRPSRRRPRRHRPGRRSPSLPPSTPGEQIALGDEQHREPELPGGRHGIASTGSQLDRMGQQLLARVEQRLDVGDVEPVTGEIDRRLDQRQREGLGAVAVELEVGLARPPAAGRRARSRRPRRRAAGGPWRWSRGTASRTPRACRRRRSRSR